MESHRLEKEILLDTYQKCLNPQHLDVAAQEAFYNNLGNILRRIWTCIASNKCGDTDSWLLHCRVGAACLHSFADSDKDFQELIHSLYSVKRDRFKLNIGKFNLKVFVETAETFRASVLYGLVSVICHKNLYTLNGRFAFEQVFAECHRQSRHNNLFFQMLGLLVKNFFDQLLSRDIDNLMDLVYYNLDKKESIIIFRCILNQTPRTQSFRISNSIRSLSWKSKTKYIIINEILNVQPALAESLKHSEIVQALIYAQSQQYLLSAAARLYKTIITNIPEQLWNEEYYFPLLKAIKKAGEPTTAHKNILKYYIPPTFEIIRPNVEDIIELFLLEENVPKYSVVFITDLAIRHSLLKENYDYNRVINVGWNDTSPDVRNMALNIIVNVKNINEGEIFEYVKKFILLNINDAYQGSRDMIKKIFEQFLIKLQNAIIRLPVVSHRADLVKYAANFFDWLLPYLLDQFHDYSNYHRVSLASALLFLTLNYFSRSRQIDNKTYRRKRNHFLNIVSIFKNLKDYFPKFMSLLEKNSLQESDKIIKMILTEINVEELPEPEISKLVEVAFKNISNSNLDVAENAQKYIKFLQNIKSTVIQEKLMTLKRIMFQQWEQLKTSVEEKVVEDNALHPVITLVADHISFYYGDQFEDYEQLFIFLEEVVHHLLNVFGLRILCPYEYEYCRGIAKAFSNEFSSWHACTVNCMWLVLKAACKLAFTIVKILNDDGIMLRTLKLIYSIVRKCSHKGALEFAAETISEIVAFATSNDFNVHVIDNFLSCMFNEMSLATDTSSAFRRAAETRVVLSAIAISDKRLNKPFYHRIMVFLIKAICFYQLESPSQLTVGKHALALHCLQPLILDNVVETQVVEYLSPIMILTVHSFNTQYWQIRNAALQTFCSVSNKLLGTKISNSDGFSQHTTCLEEIIFKYPSLYNFMIARVNEASPMSNLRGKDIIPILTFISRTYARDDALVNVSRSRVRHLLHRVYCFMNKSQNVDMIILAAKAYAVLCYKLILRTKYKRIGFDIMQTTREEGFVPIMFAVKFLTDKITEDATNSPPICNVSPVLEKLDEIMDKATTVSAVHALTTNLLLYRPIFKSAKLTPDLLEINLLYFTFNSEVVKQLPGLWESLLQKVCEQLKCERIEKLIDLIKSCLSRVKCVNLKVDCLKILTERVIQDNDVKKICEQELINLLIDCLFDKETITTRYVTDECIKLILRLNSSNLNIYKRCTMLDNARNLETNWIPLSFMPVFCKIFAEEDDLCNLYYFLDFFEFCVAKCLDELKSDNLDHILYKSVIYIFKYSNKTKNKEIAVPNMIILYRLLQRGDEELREECENNVAYCFNIEPAHTYVNILKLVNSDYIIDFLRPNGALKFLTQIFCERRVQETDVNSVFQKAHILETETNVVEEQIYMSIATIYMSNAPFVSDFMIWFNDYQTGKCDNMYILKLLKLFNLT